MPLPHVEAVRVSIAQSQLVGKKVYNPDGELVGEVYDVSLSIGESKISLLVRSKYGGELSVSWDDVAAAKDVVILKECVEIPEPATPQIPSEPVSEVESPPAAERREIGAKLSRILPLGRGKSSQERRICPNCGKPATWIPQYGKWYCYNCKQYID